VGLAFERLALRLVGEAAPLTLIIITVGAGVFLKEVAMLLWGKESYTLPPFSGDAPLHLGPATILPQNLWVLGLTLLLVLALEGLCRRERRHLQENLGIDARITLKEMAAVG
jgi:branched-chain amino acid transport system permease protein